MQLREVLERKVPASLMVLGLGLGALGLSGCSSAEAEPGPATVVGHEYTAPYTTVVFVGKTPIIQYHPADYELQLRQCEREGDKFADSQGCVGLEVDVSQETYEQYPDGSQIILPIEE